MVKKWRPWKRLTKKREVEKLKKEVQEKAREESALAMREWSTGPNSTKQLLLSQKPALPS